jgi:hypothetical protein
VAIRRAQAAKFPSGRKCWRAPERLHSQILRYARVAHDAHNPGIDIALELPDQRFESIDLAKRKSPEQIHGFSTVYYGLATNGLQVSWKFARKE